MQNPSLTRAHSAAIHTAELTALLIALTLSALTDAVVWAAPRLGRLLGRAYRLGRRHWPTVRSGLETARLTAARFIWAQAGYSPASVPSAPPSSPVNPPAIPSAPLTRRQLLAAAKALRLPGYSRLSTDQLRTALGAA